MLKTTALLGNQICLVRRLFQSKESSMNLSKPIALIYLLASSLIILCSSARAQESPSAALTRTPPAGAPRRPKIPDKCEMPSPYARNWELIGHYYVFFDYVLCPPGLQPPAPLVSVWLTAK